jgi:hypothetical protein
VLTHVDQQFLDRRVVGGFGSGEAVIDEVADPDPDTGEGGTDDKRLLVHEPEFARVLNVCRREGSILSTIIRDAWDGSRLQVRSRARKAIATGHHIAILGHITRGELARLLSDSEVSGGFANRILWVHAQRSQRLPFPTDPDLAALTTIGATIANRVKRARRIGRVGLHDDARARWAELYDLMADDSPPGLLGMVVARPEPQVQRMALLFALLDGQPAIGADHFDAAWAIWQYCRTSAQAIWANTLNDKIASQLLDALAEVHPGGLTLTEQQAATGRNFTAKELEAAREVLHKNGLAETGRRINPGTGRSRTVSVATEAGCKLLDDESNGRTA